MTIKTTRAEGFSIIEVLVAVVIFTVALVALARFMGGLMVAGSEAKARAFASSLAQEKLEDLRQFTYLPTYAEMSTNPNPPDPATFGYADIADDGGGSKEGGSVRIPAGTVDSDKVAGSNVTYDLAWSATDYYFQPGDPDAAASTTWNTAWGIRPVYSDFKQVTVTVSWLDPKGIQQFIELAGQVNSVPPSTVARAGSPEDERTSPIVHYTPQEAPDVIAIPIGIGVGGDKKKETLKPIPDVNQAGSVTWVSFGTITFEELAADVFSSLIREDFITLNCPCELEANVTNASVAKKEATPSVSRRVWNGSELIDQIGLELLKSVGSTTLGTNDAAYNLCNTCCREHHDPDATEVDVADRCDPFSGTNPERAFNCYDMNRPSEGYRSVTGGGYAHKHYNAAGDEVSTPNQEYLEACRLKRVDGIWRAFSDWRLAAITTVESQDLEDGGDLAGPEGPYVTQVQNIVNDVVDFRDVKPSSVTAIPGRTETLFQGQSTQTQSRTVYVDEMADSQLTDENFTDLSDDARLEFVPFYELNTTLLSNWYPNPDAGSYGEDVDADIARVTNEPVDSIVDPLNDYYGSYSRGVVTGQSLSSLALESASTQVVADIKRSNTGITSTQHIDPYDEAVTPSSIGVTVAAFPEVGVSGLLSTDNVESGNNKNALKAALDITWVGTIDVAGVTAVVGGSCEINWQGGAGSYSCTMQEGTQNVTVTPSASGFDADPAFHFLPTVGDGVSERNFAFDESGG